MWTAAMATERRIMKSLGDSGWTCQGKFHPCRCYEETLPQVSMFGHIQAYRTPRKCQHPRERNRWVSYMRFLRRGGDPALRKRPTH